MNNSISEIDKLYESILEIKAIKIKLLKEENNSFNFFETKFERNSIFSYIGDDIELNKNNNKSEIISKRYEIKEKKFEKEERNKNQKVEKNKKYYLVERNRRKRKIIKIMNKKKRGFRKIKKLEKLIIKF